MIPALISGAPETLVELLPALMGDLMLLLDSRRRLRAAALSTMAAYPGIFARLLALHVGEPIWSLA
jgi:hypothetical protein